ncbi:hypothetical protein TPHA_0L00830 [Tetrapisispora phaffii CBS 4417]|uniref:Small ribosomal subunit protein mS35 n=1 Tax=Tetrapisispora phaffii (strain ATCC 24235 / CBS 4417 / NBRC 1672 / NRRL Y-8282 / UCD 70-5) TaxID=1071381 RepID=G8BZW2_TETPH|nr:mitochondrial 37S ribosomal protein RSM24 TPHA_0L00830 [Tetrapisispora phaffii CBS 4417]CCE65440.1 hypothetical protein TPHA_0L00830 [Tetrapisispora phaffii CBS 4417]
MFGVRKVSCSSRLLWNNARRYSVKVADKSVSGDLYLNPAQWIGLPSEQIFQLYRERVVRLGSNYVQSKDELDALKSTSKDSDVPPHVIERLYKQGEAAAIDLSGGVSKPKFDPMPFEYNELPTPAQDLVEQHREQRFYNRLAAYDLPLLVQFRKDYNPEKKLNPQQYPAIYRYTTYLGEPEHPNNRKVSLQIKTKNLLESKSLTEQQLHVFRLLARTRYDHLTDTFKMSSDKFPEAEQNAKYLNSVLSKLIAESKNPENKDLIDVPLETSHTVAKNLRKSNKGSKNYIFPEEWKRPQDAAKAKFDFVSKIEQVLKQ